MSAIADLRIALARCGYSQAESDALIDRMGGEDFFRPRRRPPHQKDLSGPCFVYCLVNPRNGKPFYIGISSNPWSRFESHVHDASSAAWPVLRILVKQERIERDRILKIYRECPDRNAALQLEHRLIASTPKLVNKDRRRYQMWNYT